MQNANFAHALVVRVGSRCCALPLESVIEVMRPLPTERVKNMPTYVGGITMIRGFLVPVVDLGALFGNSNDLATGRFVLLRLGERRVAIAVEEVFGVRYLNNLALQSFPALMQDAYAELVAAIEIRDREFVYVLRSTHIVPDDLWQWFESREVME